MEKEAIFFVCYITTDIHKNKTSQSCVETHLLYGKHTWWCRWISELLMTESCYVYQVKSTACKSPIGNRKCILGNENHFREKKKRIHIDGLVLERQNSIANALELRLSCTNPSIYQRKLDESTARRHLKSPRSLSGRSLHLTLVIKWSRSHMTLKIQISMSWPRSNPLSHLRPRVQIDMFAFCFVAIGPLLVEI